MRGKLDIKTFKRNYKFTCEKCGRFSRGKRENCIVCGSPLFRKTTKNDYKKLAERMMNEEREFLRVQAKMKGMLDEQLIILQELAKNDEDYEKLLKRKNLGESVEDLITQNRARKEILEKENKEKGEITIKWGRSEEGREMFKKMNTLDRLNPKPMIKFQMTRNFIFQGASLREKIQKKEKELEDLLKRRDNGEYIDDLINQNRYAIEILKQKKKNTEVALDNLETNKKSDWKSRIER